MPNSVIKNGRVQRPRRVAVRDPIVLSSDESADDEHDADKDWRPSDSSTGDDTELEDNFSEESSDESSEEPVDDDMDPSANDDSATTPRTRRSRAKRSTLLDLTGREVVEIDDDDGDLADITQRLGHADLNNNEKKQSTVLVEVKHLSFLESLDVLVDDNLCHPDAKKFRDNFKSNREELVNILFKIFNEKVFDSKLEMPVVWNKKLLSTAGRFYAFKWPWQNKIELSDKVVTNSDRLRRTLIHEMCHAAAWIFDKENGHGPKWKAWARKSDNALPELPPITVFHNYDIEYKYTYKCDTCSSKAGSHFKSRKVDERRCRYCHGPIKIFLNKKQNGETALVPV